MVSVQRGYAHNWQASCSGAACSEHFILISYYFSGHSGQGFMVVYIYNVLGIFHNKICHVRYIEMAPVPAIRTFVMFVMYRFFLASRTAHENGMDNN